VCIIGRCSDADVRGFRGWGCVNSTGGCVVSLQGGGICGQERGLGICIVRRRKVVCRSDLCREELCWWGGRFC
jgi:hypothetical protein